MSGEEKLRISEEGRQSGLTISEVCLRYQIAYTQFYRWERVAREGALEGLRNGGRKVKNGRPEQRLASEVNRLRTAAMTWVSPMTLP